MEEVNVYTNDKSSIYPDLNKDVDCKVYEDILCIVYQFTINRMLIESLHEGNTKATQLSILFRSEECKLC